VTGRLMRNHPLIVLLITLAVAGCRGEVYLRDGVTDGDTFYLAERAHTEMDPVLQSWVTYSLARSVCQLRIGGENPARASSFECEMTARRLLLNTWLEQQTENPDLADEYLDDLSSVQVIGYLDEYVARYFRKQHWELPHDLDIAAFNKWRRRNLRGHKPQTNIIGSWNYAKNVTPN
jgi:hypothetical protein